MPAKLYREYFAIDEKYYAVVTKDLIDKGLVSWKNFYPHETFVRLLRNVCDMLSGKESKSILVEGTYGTGKSHAALTVKCLLEASDEDVCAYFAEYDLPLDLCKKFLAARSEEMNGKLITIHRIGSASIRNDDDLVWAVQSSVAQALTEHGIENQSAGTMKDALMRWAEEPANRVYLEALLAKDAWTFEGRNVDGVFNLLNTGAESVVEATMANLIKLCRKHGVLCMNMNPEDLTKWLKHVIDDNHLGSIVFIWDEFSEYFRNCQNALTGFQTLCELSSSSPFYFIIVSHESDSLITNSSDRTKILGRFIDPHARIELPDNMAFTLMAQAMKKTSDEVLLHEWNKTRDALNNNLVKVRSVITNSAKKHNRSSNQKNILTDEELQKIVPMHPYAAMMLKHISRVFTASQRSMFDFIISPDPTDGHVLKNSDDVLSCNAFKWFINHYGPFQNENLLTVDMLWDFFNAKATGNMNPDALKILDNYGILTQRYRLSPDEQRVVKTVLLMNAICTRVEDADMLIPTYENIDLSFVGTGWPTGKALNIAKGMVLRKPDGILFEVPGSDGIMRVIPKGNGEEIEIDKIIEQLEHKIALKDLVEAAKLMDAVKVQDSLTGHIKTVFLPVNAASANTLSSAILGLKNEARQYPNTFLLGVCFAKSTAEQAEARKQIEATIKANDLMNLLLLDATDSTFEPLWETYIRNRAYSEYYMKKDGEQSKLFAQYAQKNLDNWLSNVKNGQFRLYDIDHLNGRVAVSFAPIQEYLADINHAKYPYGVEQYSVTGTMFLRTAMGQGAECGITETEKGSFTSSNIKTKLSEALKGAWKVPDYWLDPSKHSLAISHIKAKVEELIAAGFDKNGRIDVIDIYDALRQPPYGLTVSNLSAFVMGFVLKEYANDHYFWSNGRTETMTVGLMKDAIANAMSQTIAPKASYKHEAIVSISPDLRLFLQGTADIFHEPLERCGSVDAAAGVIRVGMKRMDFPIWCIKSILSKETLQTSETLVSDAIDKYLGIANIHNYKVSTTQSDLATDIGRLMQQYPALTQDLGALFTTAKCRAGMMEYLSEYRDGQLVSLAETIIDNGAYISEVKKKFNADEANWVWAPETADAKIDDVITEYEIINQSNSIIVHASTLSGCIRNWNDRIQNIRISYDAMTTDAGDLKELLEILCDIKRSRTLPEQKKSKFLSLIKTQKDAFKQFYSHQVDMFKKVASAWVGQMSDEDIEEFFTTQMDTGVFTDSSEKFFKTLEANLDEFRKGQLKARLAKLWNDKTGTNSPRAWSDKFGTPILCMFNDTDRIIAKEFFDILLKQQPTGAEAEKAFRYLESVSFYDKLASADERDRCFMERVVEDYAIFFDSADKVRNGIRSSVAIHPYDWMDNSAIRNTIKALAEKRYKTGGSIDAQNAVDCLREEELRKYVKELIKDDIQVGIAILKKQKY